MNDDRAGETGHLYGGRNLRGLVGLDHHVGYLDGGIRTHSSHGNAHIAQCQRRRVVDAIADEDHHVGRIFLQFLDIAYFISRQQIAIRLIHIYLRCHLLHDGWPVAAQHHRGTDAQLLQQLDGTPGIGSYSVGDHKVTGVLLVNGNQHNGLPDIVYVRFVLHVVHPHQLGISCQHRMPVHDATHPVPGNLFDVFQAVVARQDMWEVLQDGFGYGVIRFRFEGDGIRGHFLLFRVGRFYFLYLEDSFGKGPGLVDDHRVGFGD